MKGFLIFMVLLVGGSIYAFTHTQEITQKAIDQLKAEEGPVDHSNYELMVQDPTAFAVKFRPFLQRREKISKWAALVGETELVLALGKETGERYDQSVLANTPEYGSLIFRLANLYEDRGQGLEAFTLDKRYLELFPTGTNAIECSSAIQRLMSKYNFR